MTQQRKHIRSTATESMHVRPDGAEMTLHIRAESHNAEDRSFEAVIITDRMTESMDAWTLERVSDVVLMDGLTFIDPLPIVDSHVASLYHMVPTTEIRGHVTDIRDEIIDGLNVKVGTLRFDSDEKSDDLYKKVQSGSVKNLSPGYTITRGVELSPGETATVNGREFTAPEDKYLLIGTQARVTEVSAVLRGADPTCRIRAAKAAKQSPAGDSGKKKRGGSSPSVTPTSENGTFVMEKELKSYLVRCGLDSNATDAQAEEFAAGLTGDQATEVKRLRAAGTKPASNPAADADRILAAERQRISEIENLAADDTPRELVRSAINEGWDVGRASQAFLQAMRDRRASNGTPAGAPAGHVRSDQGPSVRALVLSRLMSAGVQPDSEHLASSRMRTALYSYDCEIMSDEARRLRTAGAFSAEYAKDIDAASEMIGADPRDFARELLRAKGIEAPRNAKELIRTAFSGGDMSGVLDSVVYARMALAYEALPDWTRGVVAEGSNPDLKATKRVQFGLNGRMVEMPRGASPNVISTGDEAPSTVVSRKAAAVVLDELDLINGDWGDLEGRAVEALSQIAIDLRAEIVISMLLQAETQNYTADAAAVVSAARKNLITSAVMDPSNLEAARALLATQKFQNRTIGQVPRFLITPEALWGQANRLLNSTDVRSTSAEGTAADAVLVPTSNSVRAMNLQHLSDGRFDNGVPDPNDATGLATVAGTTTKFYLFAGQRNSPIELTSLNGYGAGGAPELESSMLEGGARGRRFTAVSFLGGNWVNPRGLVVLRP